MEGGKEAAQANLVAPGRRTALLSPASSTMDAYLPLDPLLSIPFGHPTSLETPSLPLSFDYSDWIHPGPSNPTPPPFESASSQGWNGSQPLDGSWGRGSPLPFAPFSGNSASGVTSFDDGSTSSTSSSARRMPSFGSLIPFDNPLSSSLFPSPFASLTAADLDPSLPLSPPRTKTPSPPSTRSIASKPRRSLASTAGPSPSISTAPSVVDKVPRTPQADESVPEAALHLLRLALPSASTTTGSVATNTTFGEDDASCDEDAEGESDATSFRSDDEKHVAAWNYGAGSALIPRGLGRRTSVSSVGSRRRQHRPAREMSVSTRAGSDDGRSGSVVAGGRRMSSRVRKTVLPAGVRMDYESEEAADEVADDSISEEDDDASPKKRAASKAAKGKGKALAPKTRTLKKRPLVSSVSRAPPSKKPRPSLGPPPRRIRRTAPPVTSPQRLFPPSIEIHPSFPRLYRSFPLSSAFPPDSYVHRHVPLSASALASTSAPVARDDDGIEFFEPPRGEGAQWNKSCDPFNLYAARFVKGKLDEKAGACPVCMESVERGGEGEVKWLKVRSSPLSLEDSD